LGTARFGDFVGEFLGDTIQIHRPSRQNSCFLRIDGVKNLGSNNYIMHHKHQHPSASNIGNLDIPSESNGPTSPTASKNGPDLFAALGQEVDDTMLMAINISDRSRD